MQYNFKDVEDVELEASKVINRIMSDKSYASSEKLSLLICQYEKKQARLDAQLSKAIKSQIECTLQSKKSVQEANHFMKEANQKTENLKEIWDDQLRFHDFMEDVMTLQVVQDNVGKVIDQLTYFVDMDRQMQKLQKMAEDESKYLLVNSKLLALIQLRNALLEDASWQRQTAMMRKEFVKVDNFETAFYDKVFEKLVDCLKTANENPEGLKISVRVIAAYDKALEEKGEEKQMRYRAIEMIKQSVDNKFDEKLEGHEDDLIDLIQHAKFANTDLIQIGQKVKSCFPSDFGIMEVYQNQYKYNIQRKIVPYFNTISQNNEYGHLVILLGWIDEYEMMLSRAGIDSTNLVSLKSKVKLMLPFFIEHNRNLLEDYIENCLVEDEKNYNRRFYEEIIRDGADLVSLFPSDIFRFVNQEAEIIKDQLKGEIFIQFVRCITEVLSMFQKEISAKLLKQAGQIKEENSESKIVDFEYKVILMINNYNECLKHAMDSKEQFIQFTAEEYKGRIEKIFMSEVQKEFMSSIPHFVHVIVEVIFLNTVEDIYPSLFSPNWLTDNSRQLMNSILKVVSAQLNDIEGQALIINIIHYRMLVKECLQYLLILFITTIYQLSSPASIQFCSEVHTQRKLGESDMDYKSVFNSKSSFAQAIKKDKLVFIKFAQAFSECTSKMFMTKLTNKFVLLGEIITKKKSEFESLFGKVKETFPSNHEQLINSILVVREDIESRAAYLPKKGMGIDFDELGY